MQHKLHVLCVRSQDNIWTAEGGSSLRFFLRPKALRVEFPGALYHLTSRGDGRDDSVSLTCNGPVYTYIHMTYCLLALNEN